MGPELQCYATEDSKDGGGDTPRKPNVLRFFHRCTLHGVRELYVSRSKALKVFWGLVIAMAAGFAAHGCYGIFRQYQETPLYVSYLVRDSSARKTPDTVICPFNRLSKRFLDAYNVSTGLAEYVQLAFGMSPPYLQELPGMYFRRRYQQELSAILAATQLSFAQLVSIGSLSCQSLIKYCFSPNYRGFYDCCENATRIITGVGTCFRLSGTIQYSSGYGFGNTIVIEIPLAEYSPSVSNLFNDGISVKLAEEGKGVAYDLTFIPSGVHALMPLRSTFYRFMNDPPRFSCLQEPAEEYSSHVCLDDCVFHEAREDCKCAHIATRGTQQYPPCRPFQLLQCLYRKTVLIANKYENRTGKTIFQGCQEKCQPSCTYWEYHPTVSYAQFPGPYKLGNVTLESLSKNNSIILDVFYERLEYTQIQHLPSMSGQEFVSNLGGQLGLWVGGSILTLVQVLMFFFQYCYRRPNRGAQQNRRNDFSTYQAYTYFLHSSIAGPSTANGPTTCHCSYHANRKTRFHCDSSL